MRTSTTDKTSKIKLPASTSTYGKQPNLNKPEGGSRPLGLPESEARALLACIATQEKPAWHTLYTSPLRKDVEARERAVDAGRAGRTRRGEDRAQRRGRQQRRRRHHHRHH